MIKPRFCGALIWNDFYAFRIDDTAVCLFVLNSIRLLGTIIFYDQNYNCFSVDFYSLLLHAADACKR